MSEQKPLTTGKHNSSGLFKLKQPLLPLQSPAISRESAVFSNGSMARDGDCHGVGGAGPGHSTGCRRLPDRSCDLSIRTSASAGNLLKRLPDLALKGSGFHVQREANSSRFPGEAMEDRAHV